MYNYLYADMQLVETVEDLRRLFSVDAQFVNLDKQYEESWGEGEESPFDKIVREYVGKYGEGDLGGLALELGEGLSDFDNDYQEYQVNTEQIGNTLAVSYAVMVQENY